MTNKFKVGDRVRVIDEKDPYFGREGHVGSIDSSNCPLLVRFSPKDTWWLRVEDVELISASKPTKPAPVNFLLAQGSTIKEFDTLAKVKAYIASLMEASWNSENIASISVYEVRAKRKVIIGTRVTIK